MVNERSGRRVERSLKARQRGGIRRLHRVRQNLINFGKNFNILGGVF